MKEREGHTFKGIVKMIARSFIRDLTTVPDYLRGIEFVSDAEYIRRLFQQAKQDSDLRKEQLHIRVPGTDRWGAVGETMLKAEQERING